ncbi:hypothetical protein L195_g027451, partial [Trifolium pratense]
NAQQSSGSHQHVIDSNATLTQRDTYDGGSKTSQKNISFFNNAGAIGGWITCDYRGRFILACSNVIHQRFDTIEGEAVAIKEASSIIKTLFLIYPNIEVKFIKRQANRVAHTLARAAYSWSSRCIFDSILLILRTL